MKRAPLAVLALVIGVAACQEMATAPNGADPQARYRVSTPPPPPIDTGAAGSFIANGLATSVQTASPLPSGLTVGMKGFSATRMADVTLPSPIFFDIPVTYFFNKTDNSGYLHFGGAAHGGSVQYHKGALDGHGTLTVPVTGGVLTVDLSSLQSPPSFLGCGNVPVPSAAPNTPPGVCFELSFTQATFTPDSGPPSFTGTVDLVPDVIFVCTEFC